MSRVLATLCALLLLCTVSVPSAAARPPSDSPDSIPTLAYFYQWFNESSWDRAKTDYPLAGRYSSDDLDVLRRQVQQAKSAGIDGFIVSWKHSAVNDRRLRFLMDVARDLDFKLAVIYQGLDFERDPLPVDRIAADMALFESRYASDPVFDILSQPLLIWSGTWKFSAADIESVTAPLRKSLLVLATEKSVEGYRRVERSFEGNAYYWSSVDPRNHRGYREKLNAMSAEVHRSGGVWLAPFAPGFDARLIGGTREVPRRGGETLREEYSAAVSSSPDALGLISWNEFSENTHVEPSENYADSALAVLSELTAGRGVPVSPLAEDSDQLRREGLMTTWAGLVAGLLLLVAVTAYSLGRRRGPGTQPDTGEPQGERAAVPQPGRRRVLVGAGVAVTTVAVALAALGLRDAQGSDAGATPLYLGHQPVRNPERPVLVAAGDISCPTGEGRRSSKFAGPNSCGSAATAELVRSLAPDAVLAIGDLQYNRGELSEFEAAYAKTWGTFRDITYPVPGNHEYGTPGATGYYTYFGARAGEPDKGYYSYDLGPWHIVALNSECEHVGGCEEGSPQARWLEQDLAAHPRKCTLAYWHHPRFSSGSHGNNHDLDPFWRMVVAAKTDLVLNGHDHDYERFTPMNADGQPDPENGTVAMVVGTGGASHYKFHSPDTTSLHRFTGENGVLRVELAEDGYSFEFRKAPGGAVLDSGSHQCR